MRDRAEVAKNYKIDITDPETAPFLDAVVDTLTLIDTLADNKDWEGLRLLQDLLMDIIEDDDEEVGAKTIKDLNEINSFVHTAYDNGQPIAPTLADWDKKPTKH